MIHTHFYDSHSLELLFINFFQVFDIGSCLVPSSVEHLCVLLHSQSLEPVSHCGLHSEKEQMDKQTI